MSAALGPMPFHLNLEPDAAIMFGGEVWTHRGRASDKQRRLLFDNAEQLVRDFSDREILQLQQQGKLRFLTLAEKHALANKHPGGRPREILDTCDKASKLRVDWIRKYVRGWEEAGRPSRTVEQLQPVIAAVARKIGDHAPPKARSLQRYIEVSEKTGGDPEAFVKQTACQGNFNKRHSDEVHTMLHDWVCKHYLVSPRPTLLNVYSMVANEFKIHNKTLPAESQLPMVGRSAVYEVMRNIDRYTETFCHRGKEEADHKYRMVEDGPVTERHNECWEIDHTTVDLIVIDDKTGLPIGRPFITMVIDRHTRLIPGFHVSWDFPGIDPTVECLRCAISPKDKLLASVAGLRNPWPAFGVPGRLVTDNAKHFYSKSFKSVMNNLGIDSGRTPLLKAWFKGRIERMFGTYARGLCHMLPGTTFSNIFQRLKEKPPEKVAVCTLAEFNAMLIRFIVDIYHPHRHRIMNTSPLLAYQESMRTHGVKRPPNPDELASKLAIPHWRKVQREGLNFEGLWYRGTPLLNLLVNKRLSRIVQIKVNPLDLTKIWFIHPETNAPVELEIQKSMRERIRGIPLDVHKLALSMQRNDPDLLAGEAGIAEAYAIITRSLEARVRGDGLANRRIASKHLDRLRERAEAYAMQDAPDANPLDPVDEVEISESLLAELSADQAEPTNVVPFPGTRADDASVQQLRDPPVEDVPEAPVAAPEAKKPPKKPKAPAETPPPKLTDLVVEDDDIDLDALTKGKTMIHKEGDET